MKHVSLVTAGLALCLVLTDPAAARGAGGSVFVVDDDGGPDVDFQDLQAAVDAAADGDLVLVRAGDYGSFEIAQKSLTVTAELGARVVVQGLSGIFLGSSDPADRVVLRGVDARGITTSTATFGGISTVDHAGRVWIEDAESCAGGVASNAASVVVARCRFTGECPSATPGIGTLGFAVQSGSSVFAFDSAFRAGDGDGDPGLTAVDAAVVGSNLTVVGGAGADGGGPFCVDGGTGGPGLHVKLGGTALLRGSTVEPGPGGTGDGCGAEPGVQGPKVELFEGAASLLAPFEQPRSLAATSPVRAGEVTRVEVKGVPGDSVFLLASAEPAPTFQAGLNAGLLLESPVVLWLGPIPTGTGGVLAQEFALPALGAGVEFVELFFQAAVVPVLPGDPLLTGGSVVDVLAASY